MLSALFVSGCPASLHVWNSANANVLFLRIKKAPNQCFAQNKSAELPLPTHCKMFIVKFGVEIFGRDKQPLSDDLFRSLVIPGELQW